MRIAILGLGHMGHAAAIRLHDLGHEVTVWNRSPGKDTDLVQRGVRSAPSAQEAVEAAEVVLTLLTNDAAVREVCLGEGRVIDALSSDAVLVDMSTVYPETSRLLGGAVPGGHFIDAPILGGPEALLNHKAKLLVGGSETIVRRLDPLWNDLAAAYFYTGENGSATTLKLLSNLILVGSTTLLAEAVATAQASGIGNDVLRQVFGQSPAVAPGVQARLEDILAGDHHGWWSLRLADKDMSLVLKLAADNGLTLPLAGATEGMIQRSIDAGYGDLDLAAIVELVRDSAATRPSGVSR
jgi:3-hydroxyisobutyrate dehydrogenase-like beta-hydroxyacid dehydrogenase